MFTFCYLWWQRKFPCQNFLIKIVFVQNKYYIPREVEETTKLNLKTVVVSFLMFLLKLIMHFLLGTYVEYCCYLPPTSNTHSIPKWSVVMHRVWAQEKYPSRDPWTFSKEWKRVMVFLLFSLYPSLPIQFFLSWQKYICNLGKVQPYHSVNS